MPVNQPFDATAIVEIFLACPITYESIQTDMARKTVVGGGTYSKIKAPGGRKFDDASQVEVEETDGEGRLAS